MQFNKFYFLLSLFVVLGALYAFSIFGTNKALLSLKEDSPVNLIFTIIVPDNEQCSRCFDYNNLIDSINDSYNINISNKEVITSNDLIFDNLIERYKLENLPAVIVSGDISDKQIVDLWKTLKGVTEEGKIVIQNLVPFYSLAEQKSKGIVDTILIKDKTCENCFDENRYLTETERIGVTIGNSVVYDISSPEGNLLVKKYKITKVPTLLLSSDVGYYPGFATFWKSVGTREKDNMFIFREVQKMGEYKDINSKL